MAGPVTLPPRGTAHGRESIACQTGWRGRSCAGRSRRGTRGGASPRHRVLEYGVAVPMPPWPQVGHVMASHVFPHSHLSLRYVAAYLPHESPQLSQLLLLALQLIDQHRNQLLVPHRLLRICLLEQPTSKGKTPLSDSTMVAKWQQGRGPELGGTAASQYGRGSGRSRAEENARSISRDYMIPRENSVPGHPLNGPSSEE